MKDNEKLDLLSALKDDDLDKTTTFQDLLSSQDIKKQRDKDIKEAKEKAQEEEIIKVETAFSNTTSEEEKFVAEYKNRKKEKRKKNVVLFLLSFIAEVSAVTYLVYVLVKGGHLLNQPHLIIQSSCFLFLTTLMVFLALVKKDKIKKLFSGFILLFLFGFIVFEMLVTASVFKIPTLKTIGDFTEVSVNKVIEWANKNHITLEQSYEYSDSIENNYVISQSLPADTLLKDTKKLEIIVSNGPNLESIVNIPNMVGWNIDDVIKKIDEKKLSNVQIHFAFNEIVARDVVFEQSKSGDIRRNEELVFMVSLGNESDLKPVELIDLVNKKEFDATLWLKRNGISYQIAYEFSDKIERGLVISTDPIKGTTINQKEITVQLVISKGPKIIAPDFTMMSFDEITEWAIKNNIHLSYDSEYSDTIKAGDIIRVSAKKGEILEDGGRIYITTSKGALKMISYDDGNIDVLRSFAIEHSITLTINEEFSDSVEKGKFIEINYKPGDVITAGSEILVKISLGKSISIPNFIGMTKSNAETKCNSTNLDCTFSYVYSSKTKGTIIYQNKDANSNVVNGTNIVLTVSNGLKPVTNNNSNTNNNNITNNSANTNNNSSNNNQSNNNDSTNTEVTPPVSSCVATTYTLGRDLLVVFNNNTGFAQVSAALYNHFSTNYPGVKLNVVGVDGGDSSSGSYIGGIGPGSKVSTCNNVTYTIEIAK